MYPRKAAAVLLCLGLVTGLVAAFDDSGIGDPSTKPTTECNNKKDDGDDDSLVDGNDPGCVKPYYLDDSEANIFDLDASWVFAGGIPDSGGPSVFYGARLGGSSSKEDSGSGGSVSEAFVDNAGSKGSNWGGGSEASKSASVNDAGTTSTNTGFAEIIDTPWDSTGGKCGDTEEDGSEDIFGCPADFGMPDDWGSTEEKSTTTITKELGDIGGQKVEYIADVTTDSGAESNNNIWWREWGADGHGGDDTINVQSPDNYNHYDVDPWNPDCQDSPDFFVKSGDTSQLRRVDCGSKSLNSKVLHTTKKDFDNPRDEHVDEYDKAKDKRICIGSDVNASCSGDTGSLCVSTTIEDVYHKEVAKDSYSNDYKSEVYWTEQDDPAFSYGKDDDTWTLTVERDVKDGSSPESYPDCSKWESYPDSCDKDNKYGDCSFKDKTYYETSKHKYAQDYESHTVDIYIERITTPWEKKDVFNANDAQTSKDAKKILFDGDYSRSINHLSYSDRGYYSVQKKLDSKQQGNDPAISRSSFFIDIDKSTLEFKSHRDSFQTFDADGYNGQGDGYVAITNSSPGPSDWRVVGSTVNFLGKENKAGKSGIDFIGVGDLESREQGDLECPADHTKCVASVDIGMANLDSWSSTSPSSGSFFQFVQGNPYGLDKSMGVCKMYKKMSGDQTVDCAFDPAGGGDGTSPTPPPAGACGDQPGEWWAYMEGPEVDDSTMDNHPGAQQACIDKKTDCVLKGEDVNEGRVANVASDFTSGFEKGEDSPDWEVCLAITGSGDTDNGDNNDWDSDGSKEDIGGEWYDLDNENVNSYLRGNSLNSADAEGDGSIDKDDVAFYWETNPGLQGTYNPEGGKEGLSTEDDCGPGLVGCDDSGSSMSSSGLFYNNFTEGARDEDYHPQNADVSVSDPTFKGYFNRIQEVSNQLEDGMDTDTYDPSTVSVWSDSDGDSDAADIFAVGQNLTSVVSSRGNVYPSGNVFYRDGVTPRSNPDSSSVSKVDKVFGNSYAAVASTSFTDDNGVAVDKGDGVWVDPDDIRQRDSELQGSWESKLTWDTDLTGPDSGLGFDTGDGDSYSFRKNGWIVYGDVYFEGEYSGSVDASLEKPMCGDDRREFLLEEQGESVNPNQFDGGYACADSQNACVDMSSTPRIVENDGYRNTDEPDENFGRLKNDKEMCYRNSGDDVSKWYDQDYKQVICRENTLYGSQGVRWITSGYIKKHPYAVKKGVDDDWNGMFEQEWEDGELTKNYTSKPSKVDSKSDIENNGWSPVPSGSPNKSINTLGFCGGDDSDERIITQRCNTRVCDTDTSVIGVVEDNEKSSCILDQAKYPQVSGDKRKIYQPGETEEFDYGDSTRKISCFDGVWYSKWPIVFQQDRMEVPKGETRSIGFSVVNVRPEPRKYRVELVDTDVARFAEFASKDGKSFVVEVPGQGSKSFQVEVYGGDTSIGSSTNYADLRVQAEAVDGEVSGEDRAGVNIVKASKTGSGEENTGARNVPGIGFLQLLVLSLISTALVFSQS